MLAPRSPATTLNVPKRFLDSLYAGTQVFLLILLPDCLQQLNLKGEGNIHFWAIFMPYIPMW